MNKKHEPSKEERHASAAGNQSDAEQETARRAVEREGGFRKGDQHRADEPRHRQQGGWNPDEDQSGRKPAADRDRDYDPDGERAVPDR